MEFLKHLTFGQHLNTRSYCIKFWIFSFSWILGQARDIILHSHTAALSGAGRWTCASQVAEAWPRSRVTNSSWFAQDHPAFITEVPCPGKTRSPWQPETVGYTASFFHVPAWFLCTCVHGLFATASFMPTCLPRMTVKVAHHLNPVPRPHARYSKLLFTPLAFAQAKNAFFYTP